MDMKLVNKFEIINMGSIKCWKTTIGRELSKRLNCKFYDIG